MGVEAGATKAPSAEPLAIERTVASMITDDDEDVIMDRDRLPFLFAVVMFVMIF